MMGPATPNKNLLIITNHFPYGIAEAFLESEINHLTQEFHKVIILSKDVTSPVTRKYDNILSYRFNPVSDWKEFLLTPFLFLTNVKKASAYFWEEFSYLSSQKREITLPIMLRVFHDIGKALVISRCISKIISENCLSGNLILYSYWLTSSLATTFVSSRNVFIKRIARAHRIDLYEDQNKIGYLSFRTTLTKKIDRVFTVSAHGAHYLKCKLDPSLHAKIEVARLGVPSPTNFPQKTAGLSYRMVSCSFLSDVKRIHLIIEALHFINCNLEWVHIGDGPLRKKLEELIVQKLSSKKNIKIKFLGAITNSEVISFYSDTYVDLFINTSASEGIPVTIMEAQSFGIPAIAFNVGGMSEIVSSENGKLLPEHSSPAQLAEAITDLLALPEERQNILRQNARRNWETSYNADKNFSTFVANILTLHQ